MLGGAVKAAADLMTFQLNDSRDVEGQKGLLRSLSLCISSELGTGVTAQPPHNKQRNKEIGMASSVRGRAPHGRICNHHHPIFVRNNEEDERFGVFGVTQSHK